MDTLQTIQQTIESSIEGASVTLSDPRGDGRHLEALVLSDVFHGMPLLKRHQLVKSALKESFNTFLHALSLKTFTHKEWEERS